MLERHGALIVVCCRCCFGIDLLVGEVSWRFGSIGFIVLRRLTWVKKWVFACRIFGVA